MGINIAIYVASQQKGFLASVAKLLSDDGHQITFIARDLDVRKVIDRALPELSDNVDVHSEFNPAINPSGIVSECLKRETKYGEFFSMISSYDRALGKGYIFNADKHPDIIRSWWTHEEKLKAILEDFFYYEHIIDDYSPDLIIGIYIDKVLNSIARYNDITALRLANAKFGSRYFWAENEYVQNSKLINAVRENATNLSDTKDFSSFDYIQQTGAKLSHAKMDYSYRTAIERALKRIIVKSYQRLKGRYKKDSYRFLSWIPPILRRPYIYNYFLKYGKQPEELQDYRLIYFPLHLEPEVALLSVSPEFNNSMEMIAWISKSLPADTLLVVKEQPVSYGIRSKHYYDNLRRIGNVVLAHPSIHSWDWIGVADVVTTITGTAGFEAVYFERPVLSFGKHQLINHLPTVRYANNFDSTREYINELLALNHGDRVFKISKEALYRAQMEVSFELPGYARIRKSTDLHMDLAEIAVEELYKQYAEVFNQSSQPYEQLQKDTQPSIGV